MESTYLHYIASGGPLLLAILGVYVSVRPPKNKRSHTAWIVIFISIGILACWANVQEMRNSDVFQDSMKSQLNNLTASIDRLTYRNIGTVENTYKLSDVDIERLASGLKPLADQSPKIIITSTLGDQKGLLYATQWKEMLLRAGWNVDGVDQAVFNVPVIGIHPVVNNPTVRDAGIIQHAFASLGVNAEGSLEKTMPDDTLKIIVGSAP